MMTIRKFVGNLSTLIRTFFVQRVSDFSVGTQVRHAREETAHGSSSAGAGIGAGSTGVVFPGEGESTVGYLGDGAIDEDIDWGDGAVDGHIDFGAE